MRCGKKLVVRLAQRVAPLVPVQRLPSLFSNMYCLFESNKSTRWIRGSTYLKRRTAIFEPGRGELHAEPNVRPISYHIASLSWQEPEEELNKLLLMKVSDRDRNVQIQSPGLLSAMMSALDDSVGNVTRALHQRGMLNNTIIIFSTDNGGPADGFDFNDASNWPLRGLKSTLWEGGVRGAGFIWSPLLRRSRYTSHHLMHITDWLPTLMHAVTADSDSFSLPQNLDGLDQWDALSDNLKSRRSEILHNINPGVDAAAVRVGDMKLVSALRGSTRSYDDWYPTDNCQTKLHGTVVNDPFLKAFYQTDTADKGNITIVKDKYQPETFHFINYSRPKFPNNGKIRPPYLSEVAPPQHSELTSILEEIGRKPVYPQEPFSLKCGPRPENASTNCKPWLQACLFNVTADPCEYENLALSQPHVVAALQKRVEFYKEHAVPPIDKPVDDAGLPYHHHGYWVPWIKAVSPSLRDDGK